MAKKLPSRPNLDQLKNQTKDLLKEYKAANVEVLALIRRHLPRTYISPPHIVQSALAITKDFTHPSTSPAEGKSSISRKKKTRGNPRAITIPALKKMISSPKASPTKPKI